MANLCKVTYDSVKLTVTINFNSKEFDCSRINGKKMEDWVNPFMLKGVRWKGFLQEMKEVNNGSEDFIVKFEGKDNELEILKKSLEGSSVRVIGSNNNVVILYKTEPLMTRITVNGKAFDASRLQGRTIDEFVYPFEVGDIKWSGIFTELEEFIGTNEYAIQFVGDQQDMVELINNAPETVNITYKAPATKGVKNNVSVQSSERYQKIVSNENIQKAAGAATDAAKKLDQSVNNAINNIQNSEQYQKIMENEKVQKVANNNIVQKITGFWKGLNKIVKYVICIVLIIVILVVVLGSCFGKNGGNSKYNYLVEDAVKWAMEEDEEALEEIKANMPTGNAGAITTMVYKDAEEYKGEKVKIKDIEVEEKIYDEASRSLNDLDEDHLYTMWDIVDEEVEAFLEFTCTVKVDGHEFECTGHMIEPNAAFEEDWTTFVTDVSVGNPDPSAN